MSFQNRIQSPKWLLSVNVIINVVVYVGLRQGTHSMIVVVVGGGVPEDEWEILQLWSDAQATPATITPPKE